MTTQESMPVFEDDPNTPDTPPEHRKVAVYPPPGQTHIVTPHGLTYATPIDGDQHIWVRRDDLPYMLTPAPGGPGCSLHEHYDEVDHRTLMPVVQGAPVTPPPTMAPVETRTQTQAPRPAVTAPVMAPPVPKPATEVGPS